MAFGAAIMHEPSVLFLDEPTSGVDPLARRAFWRMINRLADMGTAILVTTHYLEEAEQCNRLGLHGGRRTGGGGHAERRQEQQGGHLLEFIVDQPQTRRRSAEDKHGALAGVVCSATGCTSSPTTTWRRAKRDISGQAGSAPAFTCARRAEERYSLEDVFICVVEKARQQGKVAQDGG